MPTYVYKCPKCEQTIELIQKISEKIAPMCTNEDCNCEMESVIGSTTFHLKGSGWAKDGYSSK